MKNPLPKTIFYKWHNILIPSLELKWRNVWDKMKSKEEGAFIWSLWHKAMTVNSRRTMFIMDIKKTKQ